MKTAKEGWPTAFSSSVFSCSFSFFLLLSLSLSVFGFFFVLFLCFFCVISSLRFLLSLPLVFLFVCSRLLYFLVFVSCSSELAPDCWSFEGNSTVPLLCFTLPLVFSLHASSVFLSFFPLVFFCSFVCCLFPRFPLSHLAPLSLSLSLCLYPHFRSPVVFVFIGKRTPLHLSEW